MAFGYKKDWLGATVPAGGWDFQPHQYSAEVERTGGLLTPEGKAWVETEAKRLTGGLGGGNAPQVLGALQRDLPPHYRSAQPQQQATAISENRERKKSALEGLKGRIGAYEKLQQGPNPYAIGGDIHQRAQAGLARNWAGARRQQAGNLAARGILGSGGLDVAARGQLAGYESASYDDLRARYGEREEDYSADLRGRIDALTGAKSQMEFADPGDVPILQAFASMRGADEDRAFRGRLADQARDDAYWDRIYGLIGTGVEAGGTIAGSALGPGGALVGNVAGKAAGGALSSLGGGGRANYGPGYGRQR